jgi:hypothetical protein
MTADPALTLPEVQAVMRHAHLSTTQQYMTPRLDELIGKLQAHFTRPLPPPVPAPGYDPDDLAAAFGDCGGETWQDRWVNGGFDQAGHPVSRIRADRPATPALAVLFALRVITPSVSAVRGNRLLGYPGLFRTAQADPALDALFEAAGQLIPQQAIRREALTDITVALTTEAVALADLPPGRFLNYVLDSRNHVITTARHQRKRGYHAWDLLHRAGHFPPGTPDTMKEAIREPRLIPAALVARHDLTDPGVRQLLADYLTVRGSPITIGS